MAVKNKKKSKKFIIIEKPKSGKVLAAVAAVLIIALVVSVLVIANGPGSAKGSAQYDFGKKVADGIDVSEHNKKVDWEKVAKNKDFAFIRVGYRGYGNGKIVEDKYAKENLKGANDAGIPVGVYFYTQAITPKEAKEEAKFVIDMIKHYDISLPIVIDFEYPDDETGMRVGRLCDANLNSEEKTDIINAFCSYVENKGYAGGVYASSSVLNLDINTKKLSKDTLVWLADYNKKVTYNVDYTIWQYSKTGSVDGVESEFVDLNYWYK